MIECDLLLGKVIVDAADAKRATWTIRGEDGDRRAVLMTRERAEELLNLAWHARTLAETDCESVEEAEAFGNLKVCVDTMRPEYFDPLP